MNPHSRNPLLEGLLSTDLDNADLIDGMEDDDIAMLLDSLCDLPPVPPPARLRDRVLHSASPYHSFADRVAHLFEIGADTVRDYLRLIGQAEAWQRFFHGAELLHVEGGPALRGADVGFVRVTAGTIFPHHGHGGEERTLMMEGELVDSDGRRYGPGDYVVKGPGTEHHFEALTDVLFAVVVWGVRFDDDLQGRLHN